MPPPNRLRSMCLELGEKLRVCKHATHTQTKKMMECTSRRLLKVNRKWTWTLDTLLSTIVMLSLFDISPLSKMGKQEIFAVAVSISSLGASFIITAIHNIESMKSFVGGTFSEFGE